MRSSFISLCYVLSLLTVAKAIKFDLSAVAHDRALEGTKCLSQYIAKDSLVLVSVNVGEGYNQRVDLEIRDDVENGNVYVKKNNVNSEFRNAFTTTSDNEVAICFNNVLDNGFQEGPSYKRSIDVKLSIGAEAADLQKSANAEKLDPLELELRKLETVVKEIVDEMNYLKRREARLRDTNESTNDRVKWFSVLSLFTLFSLGTWQILYLRRYFKRKRLID